MLFNFIDLKTVFLIFHAFGVAIGAGGAFMSDLMFFKSSEDKKFSATEIRFLKLGSQMVWFGLGILFVSGALIFSLDPENYLNSSKFMAKMTIVGIIVLNGIIFHRTHIPRIERHAGEYFTSSDEFVRKSSLLFASGAISIISWSSALILGMLRQIPYSYLEIMAVYLVILICGIFASLIFSKKVFFKSR